MKYASSLGALVLVLAFSPFAYAQIPPATQATSAPASQAATAPVFSAWPFDAAEAARRQQNTASVLGVDKEITVALSEKISMKLVLIPAGKFKMGSPEDEKEREANETQHEVTISKPFYMAACTVTQEQYELIMNKTPSVSKGATKPVENVSWPAAMLFCQRLSEKTGRKFTLPRESQWEYACRAGTATPFNTGETISSDQANFNAAIPYGSGKEGKNRQDTVPVGQFKPNALGLYDMHGNVWQWCLDIHDPKHPERDDAPPPTTQPTTQPKVQSMVALRGGAWDSLPADCRSARRNQAMPTVRDAGTGFRVICIDLEKKK